VAGQSRGSPRPGRAYGRRNVEPRESLCPGSDASAGDEQAYEAKLAELARVIGEIDPDVLAVQEVGDPEALEDLRELLDADWQAETSDHENRVGTCVRHVDQGLETRQLQPSPRQRQPDDRPRCGGRADGRLNLEDALRVALRPCDHEPENAERAALRWLGRLCLERRDVTLAEVREALDAFAVIVEEPDGAEATLRRLSTP
jgi:hypothetical protein